MFTALIIHKPSYHGYVKCPSAPVFTNNIRMRSKDRLKLTIILLWTFIKPTLII